MISKTAFVLLMAMTVLSACGRDHHDHPQNISGKALFDLHCASCHGPSGDGSFLLGVPSNSNGHLLNVEIRNKIQHGKIDGNAMPVFEHMSDAEANKIIRYLNDLAQKHSKHR